MKITTAILVLELILLFVQLSMGMNELVILIMLLAGINLTLKNRKNKQD